MTDETGGKPLTWADVAMVMAGHDIATGPAAITIPTAAFTELIAAAEECAGAIETRLGHAPDPVAYPHYSRCHERALAPVRRLRVAVARVRGE
jgi:hypothetical protein